MTNSDPHDFLTDDDMPIVVLPDGFDLEEDAVDLTQIDDRTETIIDVFAIPESVVDEAERMRIALRDDKRRLEEERLEREKAARAAELRRLRDLELDIDAEIAQELDEARRRVSVARLSHACAWVLAASLGLLLAVGWTYYTIGFASRPFHALHPILRSSGAIGLSLGLAGTMMMAASMAYLVRKRLVSRLGAGSLPGWMRFHVATGLLGPALIFFHAAFAPTSALGSLALFGMTIVVGSGVLGRYLLLYVPKSADGSDVQVEDLRGRLRVYQRKLVELGIEEKLIPAEVDFDPRSQRSPWLITAIFRVFLGDRESRAELKRLHEAVHAQHGAGTEAHTVLILLRRSSRERQWLVRHRELRRLVNAWRFAHRWLAIVMWSAVAFHIVIALKFGDLVAGLTNGGTR